MTLDILRRQRRRRADYSAAFHSEAGRRVLADLFRFCHMDQPSFAVDPFITAFNEGQRRVFLRIAAMTRMSDEDFLKLSMESQDE